MSAPNLRPTLRAKLRVFNTQDIPEPKVSVLYWGRAKTGKTHNAMTWPKPFVIYWDQNQATLRKFPGIQYVVPDNIEDFDNNILPLIRGREIDADTIIFDSYSFAAYKLREEIQGTREKMRTQDWGLLLDKLMNWTHALTRVVNPNPTNPDARTYNVVGTVHDRDITDEDGALVRVTTAIQGQFQDWLPRFFDCVLVTGVENEKKMVKNADGTSTVIQTPRRFVHSIPPSEKWLGAGDAIGGVGSRFAELPPKIDGTYPSLAKAWRLTTTNK